MRRFRVGSLAAAALCGIGLSGLAGLTLALPAFWLNWEGGAAAAHASLVAEAAAGRTEAALQAVITGFDRAASAVRPDQLPGDTVSLTARLLRMEPLVAPVTGLVVVNASGVRVAASSVAIDAADKPLWWAPGVLGLPKAQAGILGCAGAKPPGAGFILARRIVDDAGNDIGAVGGSLAMADLAALATPAGPGAGSVAFTLADNTGCVLARGNNEAAGQNPATPGPALFSLYRRWLPKSWLIDPSASVTKRFGNLVWTGTLSPEASLGLQQPAAGRHAALVQTVTLALLGLEALLAAVGLAVLIAALRGRREQPPRGPADTNLSVQALAAMASMASRPVPARKDSPAEAIARASAPGGRTALVVGFVAGERARVASQLTLSGVTVETAEDGFVALGMAERSVYLHGGLDLLVLDASLDGLPVQALLSRLKGHVDFDRLRIVLISAGRIAGAFGGTPDGKAAPAASDLDALVAGIFGKVPVPAELQAGASGRTGQQRMLAQ